MSGVIQECAIFLGTFLGVFPDFWVSFCFVKFDLCRNNQGLRVLLMTLWNAACRALVSYFFSQI